MNSTIEKTSTKSQLRKQYKELFQKADLYKYGFADDIIDNILKFTDDAPLEYIKNECFFRFSYEYQNESIKFYDKHKYVIHAYLFEKTQDHGERLLDMLMQYRYRLQEYKVNIIRLFDQYIDADLYCAAECE